jgi:hypothetical protein
MKALNIQRIDEVSKYYTSVEKLEMLSTSLFWINTALSFAIPYSTSIVGKIGADILQIFFVVFVFIYFTFSQLLSLYFLPRAESVRRKQFFSDSFGVPLSEEHTSLYYNNSFSPSVQRLGANTMENAFFSKEIALTMLGRKRVIVLMYVILWLLAFTFRHNNLELLTWITQFVFSGEIVFGWVKLEILRVRCQQIYDELYYHFLHKIGQDSSTAIATILNACTTYEAVKSAAGILLSSKDFKQLNQNLTNRWQKTCQELNMEEK